MTKTGAFDERFSARRKWKRDAGLLRALQWLFPPCYDMRFVLDVGAGGGAYVEWFADQGYAAGGVDGTPNIYKISEGQVIEFDLSVYNERLPDVVFGQVVEVFGAICIEVGEHIPPQFAGAVFDNLAATRAATLVVSWATPGQRGRGHVNCLNPNAVALQMLARGYQLDARTDEARRLAGRGWDHKLLVFKRVKNA